MTSHYELVVSVDPSLDPSQVAILTEALMGKLHQNESEAAPQDIRVLQDGEPGTVTVEGMKFLHRDLLERGDGTPGPVVLFEQENNVTVVGPRRPLLQRLAKRN